MKKERVHNIFFPIICSILIILFLFLISSLGFILISDYQLRDFLFVTQMIMKKGGSYSTLLTAITATIFFQGYLNAKKEEKEREEKIKGVGHYALTFRTDDKHIKSTDEKLVVLISDEEDYKFEKGYKIKENAHAKFVLEFLTSRTILSHLKNIMAFELEYFQSNQREIIQNYLECCQKVEYSAPIFTRVLPFHDLTSDNYECLFTLIMKIGHEQIKQFWITAITEDGILYLNKVKIKLMKSKNGDYRCELLQQTNYFVQNGKLTGLMQ